MVDPKVKKACDELRRRLAWIENASDRDHDGGSLDVDRGSAASRLDEAYMRVVVAMRQWRPGAGR